MRARLTLATFLLAAVGGGCASLLGIEDDYEERTSEVDGGAVVATDLQTDGASSEGAVGEPAETGFDAEVDSAEAEAGPSFVVPPSSPALIECADTGTCAAQTQRCCVIEAGSQCIGAGAYCPWSKAIRYACDETADCVNTVCCLENKSHGGVGDWDLRADCTTYSSNCQGVLCRTDAECAAHNLGRCELWPCEHGPLIATCSRVGFNPLMCFP